MLAAALRAGAQEGFQLPTSHFQLRTSTTQRAAAGPGARGSAEKEKAAAALQNGSHRPQKAEKALGATADTQQKGSGGQGATQRGVSIRSTADALLELAAGPVAAPLRSHMLSATGDIITLAGVP